MTAHFVEMLEELRGRSLRMAGLVEDIVQEAGEAVTRCDEALARRVIARDDDVDAEEIQVESEVVRLLALYQPVGSDLRLLCTILKVNNDLERIADCAVNVAERARHLKPEALKRLPGDVATMEPMVRRMLRTAVQAYASEDQDLAKTVFAQDNAVDALYEQIIRDMVADPSQSSEMMASQLDVLSIAKNLERIADHATNIAEDVVFLQTGKIVRHRSTRKEDATDPTPTADDRSA